MKEEVPDKDYNQPTTTERRKCKYLVMTGVTLRILRAFQRPLLKNFESNTEREAAEEAFERHLELPQECVRLVATSSKSCSFSVTRDVNCLSNARNA